MNSVSLNIEELKKLLESTQYSEDPDGYSRCGCCHGGDWGWPLHTKDCLFVKLARAHLSSEDYLVRSIRVIDRYTD